MVVRFARPVLHKLIGTKLVCGEVAWYPAGSKLNCARRMFFLTEIHLAQFYLLQIMVFGTFRSVKQNYTKKTWDPHTLQNSPKLVQHYNHDLITS